MGGYACRELIQIPAADILIYFIKALLSACHGTEGGGASS